MIKNNKNLNSCYKAGGVLFCLFVATLFAVFSATFAQAQTAMVTQATVNYPSDDNAPVNYQCIGVEDEDYNVSFIYSSDTSYGNLNDNMDPWHNSALIEFDQPYPDAESPNKYPNHCLQLCAEVTCVNPSRKVESSDSSSNDSYGIPQDVGSSDFPIQSVLFEIFKYQPGSNPYNADTTPPIRTIALTPTEDNVCPGIGTYTQGTGNNQRLVSCCELFVGEGSCLRESCVSADPSVCPSPCAHSVSTGCYLRENSAAEAFCGKFGQLKCNNASTGWQANKYCKWNGSKCVPKCSSLEEDECGYLHNRKSNGSSGPSLGSPYDDGDFQVCEWREEHTCTTPGSDACRSLTLQTCGSNPECVWTQATSTNELSCKDTIRRFHTYEQCKSGITKLPFCTSWDGSYEIDGEFGKSNGQFGFRANVKTKWPGDGISSSGDVEVDHTMAYPGENQIPIQVDVTNVHSVRSSSTMVGTTTKVPAQPYELTYKLSKDATTTIRISDPGEGCWCKEITEIDPNNTVLYTYFPLQYNERYNTDCMTTTTNVQRFRFMTNPFNIVNGQPRLGEGIPDGVNINLDSWDGRDDQGIFLPYGNYLVDITATTRDEWSLGRLGLTSHVTPPAPDISRTATRQLSLDPLKITDIKESGLAKLSTSYAKIDYVLTEPATVHLMVFTPGTVFDTVDMPGLGDPADVIESRILYKSGTLVAHIVEQKQARVNVNTKWDGVCRHHALKNPHYPQAGYEDCRINETEYLYGTPMPDGDYVYVLWAEIPYPKYLRNNTDWLPTAVCVNNKWWAGVRTNKYHNGILPINRGLPDITVGAVGYSTLGSSPTAFGLDPFTFNYSVSRDAIVDATIKTTAPDIAGGGDQVYTVKHLLTNEVAVSAKQNHFTWDGIDDEGYQVSPGTYMVEFVAKDSLYPEKQATMTVQFPVDLFRVVDVSTTPILDEATSQAKINYTLSKSMDVVVEIYDQDVTIPTKDCEPGQQYSTTTAYSSTTAAACWCQYGSSVTASATDWYLLPASDDPTKLLKSFTLPKAGEGVSITEVWDGLKFVQGREALPVADGNYPYRICTRSTQDISHWYKDNNGLLVAQNGDDNTDPDDLHHYKDGASDKPTGFISVARGSIAFNKVLITPSQPEMKYSTETIYLPSYEIGLSTSRSAKVQIEVISTAADQCLGTTPAGTVCRTLSTYAYDQVNAYFDPTKIYKVYWDGKDSKGEYVKYGSYEIRLTGLSYPEPISTPNPMLAGDNGGKPLPTIFSQVISVNNFQVYDRYVEDITRENPNGKFAYQISVPMKVAIQILKPGTTADRTTIANNAIGLIDPVTRTNVQDINNVLVKAIVGIRPNLVSLDEVWDGTDYAGQEVPDGIYPFRYVTTMNAYDMDSVTGAVNNVTNLDQAGAKVADWEKYITLEHINVARGDSWYADVDWKSKKVTSFFPNPLNEERGWFEITKLPAPGKVSIKIFNIAGDLVRSGGYPCVNAQGVEMNLDTINAQGGLQPYMLGYTTAIPNTVGGRNFTLRCEWNKTNDHGKKVARGLYYAIMELDPTRGNSKKSQRVIKILIP